MLIDGEQFIEAGTLLTLQTKGAIHLKIMGKPVSVFSHENAPYALEMSCKHQGASLAAGKIQGTIVTCPRHGWQYDLRTGACQNANSPSLRFHPVHIENDTIYVGFYPISR